jgi:hypothetical protein
MDKRKEVNFQFVLPSTLLSSYPENLSTLLESDFPSQ